jgi:hypothetical protein
VVRINPAFRELFLKPPEDAFLVDAFEPSLYLFESNSVMTGRNSLYHAL